MKPLAEDRILKINGHDLFYNDIFCTKYVRKVICKSTQFQELVTSTNETNPVNIHTLFWNNYKNLTDIEIVEIVN